MEKTFEPHGFLKRKKIREQLERVFDFPLTLVVAAMGYGKTVSVRDYLDEIEADYVWLNVESDEPSVSMIWDSFTRQFAANEPEIGSRLKALGYPTSTAHRDRVFDTLEEWTFQARKALVIDDYHFANSPELDLLMEKLVQRKIPGLHLVLLSRTRPGIRIEELKLKGYCHQLKNPLFELNREEIREYFLFFNQDIPDHTAEQVQQITEGWITAVYLVCQRYSETGRLEVGVDVNELIHTAVMSRYSEKERKLLMSLSILESFTLPQAVYITENKAAVRMIQKLARDSSFIRFDERTETYIIHNIFLAYLRALLEEEAEEREILDSYRRSGEWYIAGGIILQGLNWLLKAKGYDLILEEFEKPGRIWILDNAPLDTVRLFEQIPQDVKYRHPIGYLSYADFYLTRVDLEEGARLLAEIEAYYQRDDSIPPPQKRRILGEIELIRSFSFFNDIRKMQKCCLKAHELLDGCSRVAHKDMMFTFGSPSTLYIYHRDMGGMLGLVEFVEKSFYCYQELSGGCGKGFENLIRAEYSLERGELDPAEFQAYKAVYRADTMDQVPISICACFTLARLYAARGKFREAGDLLDELSVRVAEYNNPVFMNSLDLCYGYLGGLTGQKSSFVSWLKSGDMKHDEMFYQGLSFNYIVHARYLLLEGSYLKLEALCEEMHRLFAAFTNLLGHLHAHTLDAVAKLHLYGMAPAKKSLQQALAIGEADGITLPFAEYGKYIFQILADLAGEDRKDVYLKRLTVEASRYRHNLEHAFKNEVFAGHLTEREKTVLRLLLEGCSNREIAGRLFIAEITVKKNVTSIYRKLGVSSRAAAVRRTMELNLLNE